jgi:type II secretory pathway pseudopilin PulG
VLALRRDEGASLIDVLVVLAIIATVTGISVPASGTFVDAGRARQAAAFVASRFRLARIEALNKAANVGVVFDLVDGRWSIRICRDGNRNGLRRADIRNAIDPCVDGPHHFSALFPGVEIAVDPTLRGPAGEPPSPDPVRFGTSDMASFSPNGSCTGGSLFLRTPRAQQYAIRMAGVNGRLRVFKYDLGARLWREP